MVLTTELPLTYQLLAARRASDQDAPRAVGGGHACRGADRRVGPAAPQHQLRRQWSQTFDEIIRDGVLMSDPSILVTMPTAGDPPWRRRAAICSTFWPVPESRCRHGELVRSGRQLRPAGAGHRRRATAARLDHDADILDVVTPADWARQGMTAGTLRVGAHLLPDRRSGRPTWCAASTTPSWRAAPRSPEWVCPPPCCPGGWPPSVSPGHSTIIRTDERSQRSRYGHDQDRVHAAGIEDERLRESYRYCRRLNAQHGRTYFLATRLLTRPSARPCTPCTGSPATPTTSSTTCTRRRRGGAVGPAGTAGVAVHQG